MILLNKRGQSLPLNTLVITILVVIVLIVVAVFFLGGTSSLSKSIRNIFYGTTTGTDIALAREFCEQRCEQAQNIPNIGANKAINPFCRKNLDVDTSGNGNLEESEKGLNCPDLVSKGIVAECKIGTQTVSC